MLQEWKIAWHLDFFLQKAALHFIIFVLLYFAITAIAACVTNVFKEFKCALAEVLFEKN